MFVCMLRFQLLGHLEVARRLDRCCVELRQFTIRHFRNKKEPGPSKLSQRLLGAWVCYLGQGKKSRVTGLRQNAYFFVEVMNSKRKVKGNLGHVVQIYVYFIFVITVPAVRISLLF